MVYAKYTNALQTLRTKYPADFAPKPSSPLQK